MISESPKSARGLMGVQVGGQFGIQDFENESFSIVDADELRPYLHQLEERIAALERQEPSPAQVGRKERDLDVQGYKPR